LVKYSKLAKYWWFQLGYVVKKLHVNWLATQMCSWIQS